MLMSLPPVEEAIDDEITGLSRLSKIDRQLPTNHIEDAKGHQDRLPMVIVVIGLQRLQATRFALARAIAKFDFGFTVNGQS